MSRPLFASQSSSTALLFACSVLLFIVLVIDHERSVREIASAVSEIDSLHSRILVTRANQDSLFAVGDVLPDIPLLSGDTDSLSLRGLAARHGFLYFGRDDCLPCQILRPLLAGLPRASRTTLAVVSMSPSDSGDQGEDIINARLQMRGSLGRRVQGTPTLIHVAADGTVLSVAHASLPRVLRMITTFQLASSAVVDSVIGKEFADRNIPMALIGAAPQPADSGLRR